MKIPRPLPVAGWISFLLPIPITLLYWLHLFGMAFDFSAKGEQTTQFLFWILAILNPVGTVLVSVVLDLHPLEPMAMGAFFIGWLISPLLWSFLAGWIRGVDENEHEDAR